MREVTFRRVPEAGNPPDSRGQEVAIKMCSWLQGYNEDERAWQDVCSQAILPWRSQMVARHWSSFISRTRLLPTLNAAVCMKVFLYKFTNFNRGANVVVLSRKGKTNCTLVHKAACLRTHSTVWHSQECQTGNQGSNVKKNKAEYQTEIDYLKFQQQPFKLAEN